MATTLPINSKYYSMLSLCVKGKLPRSQQWHTAHSHQPVLADTIWAHFSSSSIINSFGLRSTQPGLAMNRRKNTPPHSHLTHSVGICHSEVIREVPASVWVVSLGVVVPVADARTYYIIAHYWKVEEYHSLSLIKVRPLFAQTKPVTMTNMTSQVTSPWWNKIWNLGRQWRWNSWS